MSDDAIRNVLLIIIGCTALTTLAFPVLFSRYAWRQSAIGRALMLESASTAIAVCVSFILALTRPPIEVRLIVYVLTFGFITISSARLTWTMLRINNEDRIVPRLKKDKVGK